MAGVRVPVEFDGDFSQLMSGLESSLSGVGQKLSGAGSALTKGITAPLVALGTLGAREFSKFEGSLTKIENLTGLTGQEIEKLSPQIRKIGTTAGISGTEAADAFFFLQSGLGDSAKAMDALDAATRGSAVGLGSTETISKALVSVMANFGDEAGNATDIMNTFGSAAQASSLDADQIASGLQGVIPFAAQAGVSLDDLAATMAVLSPNFSSGAEAGTAMRAAMRAIVAPTQEAEKMLEDAGTSSAELSKIVGKQGLSGAMAFLGKTFDGSQKDLTRMLGSSEAAAAVMGFLGADAETVASTFENVANKTFSLDEAFGKVADDSGFRVTQSLARMKDALLPLGAAVLPVVADVMERVAGVVTNLSDRFANLPGPVQSTILAVAGIAAAIGPALLIAGQFATSLAALAGAGGLGKVAGAALRFLGPIGLVVGALVAAWQTSEPFRQAVFDLGETIQEVAQGALPEFVALGDTLTTTILPMLASLFATVAATVGELLAAVLPLVGVLITKLAPIVTQLAGAFAGLLAAILPVVVTIVSELAPVIAQLVTTILPPLIDLFGQVASVIGSVVVPILTFLADLFTNVLAPAITALLPIVASVFQTIGGVIAAAIKIFSGLIQFVTGVFTGNWGQAWNGIKTIFSGVVDAIMAVVKGWIRNMEIQVGRSMDQQLATIRDAWNRIFNAVVAAVTRVIVAVRNAFNTVTATVTGGITRAYNAVRSGWNSIVSATSAAFSRIVSTIGRGISNAVSTIRSGWNTAVSATGSAFSRIVGAVVSGASRVASSVRSGFARAVSAARSALSNMVSAVRSGIGRVISVLASIPGRARSAVSGLSGALVSAGRNLIMGLIGGIRSAAGAVASAARSVVQNAINAARSALGIASPSKVFEEIGRNTGQGMAVGLDATRGLVQAAADRSLVPDITASIGRWPSTSTARATAGLGDVGEGTATVVLNEYGPRTDSAKRREIDWALKHPTRGRTFQTGQLAVV